jgi:hypothetical protein
MALHPRAVCFQRPGMMAGSVLVAAPARRLISPGVRRVCCLLAQATVIVSGAVKVRQVCK